MLLCWLNSQNLIRITLLSNTNLFFVPCTLMELPQDVVMSIVYLLDAKSALSLCCTCLEFSGLVECADWKVSVSGITLIVLVLCHRNARLCTKTKYQEGRCIEVLQDSNQHPQPAIF